MKSGWWGERTLGGGKEAGSQRVAGLYPPPRKWTAPRLKKGLEYPNVPKVVSWSLGLSPYVPKAPMVHSRGLISESKKRTC